MAVRCGVDLVEVGRIEAALLEWEEAFRQRLFTREEVAYCETRGVSRFRSYAARFAAKEAAAKALGTGISDGVSWNEIEVAMNDLGAPVLHFHGGTREFAERLGVLAASVSLSHTETHAIAVVVLELRDGV